MAQIHRDGGVEVRTGERVESVRDTGTGLHITTDRSGIDCGALLVAVGLQPNSELAQAAGITCDNGILVDAYCRTEAWHMMNPAGRPWPVSGSSNSAA